ncbi:MAG: polysaccharide biosynthesis tyrosine autokinase [Bryobacteraceae bacterium]|nr:polysaccharide biosynthesis tyrosine autokinase [Bryobacteraceae bacterium]
MSRKEDQSKPAFGQGDTLLPMKFEFVDNPPAEIRTIEPPQQQPAGFDDEEDDGGGLLDYWRLLRRRKGTVIIGAAAGLLIGVAVTLPQTPIYKASTSLEIQSLNQNFMNMQNVQQTMESSGWDGLMDIQTQIKIIQSESLVERVLAAMKDGEAPAPAPAQHAGRVATWRRALNLPEPKPEDTRSLALNMAAGSVTARNTGQTRIVEISVESTDPRVAAAFANKLTTEYMDQAMEARWQSSQRTGVWLTRQLDDMRIKLERGEDALQSYAQRNSLLFTGEDKTSVDETKLKQIQDQLTAIQGDRVSKQSRWEMASSSPAESLPDVLNDSSLRSYQEKLADLRRQRDELLETFMPENTKVKRVEAQISSLERSLDRERSQILRRIKNEFDEAVRKEKLLQSDYDKQARLVTVQGEKAIQYNILKREVETNRQLYESMLQRVKEAGLASALKANNVRVVDPAKVPEGPVKPRPVVNAGVGFLLGMMCSVGFVLVTEKADRTLQDPSDVPFYLGTRELGIVPSASLLHEHKHRRLLHGKQEEPELSLDRVTAERRLSVLAESFRSMLTSILFSGNGDGRPKALVVTSANPSEGKTTVATNLSIAIAETGMRVLLIDGDTRKGRIDKVFGVENDEGLTSVLRNPRRDWRELVQETQFANLSVLTTGPGVAGPSNFLHARQFPAVMQEIREEYDMVVIDTPPALQIPDARLIGRLADGIILVVRAGQTTRDAAIAVSERLRQDGVTLLGTVLNDWDPKNSPAGYYGYYNKGYKKYYHRYHSNRPGGEEG